MHPGAWNSAAHCPRGSRWPYLSFDDAEKSPVEIVARASGERTMVAHTPQGDSTTTYDGTAAWIAAPATDKPVPLMEITGEELGGVKLDAAIFFPVRVKQMLTNWRVGIPIIIDDRDAVQVQGDIPGGGVATLCFDEETGLLVRMVRYTESPVGRLVTRIDYHEYRDVAGVKIPSRWTMRWLSGRQVIELIDIQPNVQIPAGRFARPSL